MKFPVHPPAQKLYPAVKTTTIDTLLALSNGLIDAANAESPHLKNLKIEDTFEEFNDLRDSTESYGLVYKSDPDGSRPHAVWAYIGPKNYVGSKGSIQLEQRSVKPGRIDIHSRKADEED